MRFFLAIFFLVVATSAQASFGPLVFSPLTPNSNDSLVVSVETVGCDVFVGGGNPNSVQIQREGSVIKITSLGISYTDPVLCFFPRDTARFTVGPVPAGSYSVELYLRDFELPTLVDLVQTGNLNVTQGQIILKPVPSNSLSGLLFLLFLLFVTGIIGIGKRP